MRQLLFWCLTALLIPAASADEVRPGYLQLQEITPEHFSVLWKVPARGGRKLGLDVLLPENCTRKEPPEAVITNGAWLQRWIVACRGGLGGRKLAIDGLERGTTDVLLQLEYHDGSSHSAQLTPARPGDRIPEKASWLQVAATYTLLGVEHILEGFDHLLFVLALLLIVRDWRVLLATITAFTLAHSLTLAVATLGVVRVPQQPVEAVIALSILFLASEWMHNRQGRPGAAARWPWLVAFTFGLLHGFGFAGALAEVGLPQHAVPLALVFFNLGVEVGQLLFIAAVLALAWLLHRLHRPQLVLRLETLVIYAIGALSSFWLFERIGAF